MKRTQMDQLEPIRFIEFWQMVANELGTSRLRINSRAKSIHEFVDRDSDALEYLQAAIRKSYKLSKCQHLASPISIDCVLDILGETAYALQGDQRDDLFDIELLEEIAWHIGNRYLAYLDLGTFDDGLDEGLDESLEGNIEKSIGRSIADQSSAGLVKTTQRARAKRSAQVISFPNYKIRRANSRL